MELVVIGAITVALQLIVIAGSLMWNRRTDKRVHKAMVAEHGAKGLSKPWIGTNGKRYAYDLESGRIVPA